MKKTQWKWPKGVVHHAAPLYGVDVYLCLYRADTDACMAYLTRGKQAGASDHRSGSCVLMEHTGLEPNLILVSVFDRRSSTLVHELAHATFFILGGVDVPVVAGEKNEAYCCLLDSLFAFYLPYLSRRRK